MKFPRFPRRICGPRIWDMNLWGVVFAKWHHTTNKQILLHSEREKKIKSNQKNLSHKEESLRIVRVLSLGKLTTNLDLKHEKTLSQSILSRWKTIFLLSSRTDSRWECRSLRCKMILKFICVHIYVRLLLSLKHSFLSLQIGLYLHDMT